MNFRTVAALVLSIAVLVGLMSYLRSVDSPPPHPAPDRGDPKPEESVWRGEDRPYEVDVFVSQMPEGYFATRRLTDSLDDLDASYATSLPSFKASLESLGFESTGEPVVFVHGTWGTDGFAELALPIQGAAMPENTDALRKVKGDGFAVRALEGGDAFRLELKGPSLARTLMKAEEVMKLALEKDRSPQGGSRIVSVRQEAGKTSLSLTQDVTEAADRFNVR